MTYRPALNMTGLDTRLDWLRGAIGETKYTLNEQFVYWKTNPPESQKPAEKIVNRLLRWNANLLIRGIKSAHIEERQLTNQLVALLQKLLDENKGDELNNVLDLTDLEMITLECNLEDARNAFE